MDTVDNLKMLYKGKKTVEVTVDSQTADAFYHKVGQEFGAGATVNQGEGSALVLTDNPKEALASILNIARETGAQIEWLNVRRDTLEDVFIHSVSRQGTE